MRVLRLESGRGSYLLKRGMMNVGAMVIMNAENRNRKNHT